MGSTPDRKALLDVVGAIGSPRNRQMVFGPAQLIPIRSLRQADSPRVAGASERHAHHLADIDATLPPIVVHAATMRVIDGMHRLRAAEIRGETEIEGCFFDGTEEDAFIIAVEANVSNGLPLSLADRRSAAARIIASHPVWSDRWIASVVGLTAKTVRVIRRCSTEENQQPNTRIGRDGRVRPIDGGERRRLAEQVLRDNPNASVREIASRVGIAPSTALDVRNRFRSGNGDVPASGPDAERQDDTTDLRRTASRQRERDVRGVSPIVASSILRRLRMDPSLRLKESGRLLVRWLGARTVDPVEWQPLVERIPPHCAEAIVVLARYNAAAWEKLSEQIQQR